MSLDSINRVLTSFYWDYRKSTRIWTMLEHFKLVDMTTMWAALKSGYLWRNYVLSAKYLLCLRIRRINNYSSIKLISFCVYIWTSLKIEETYCFWKCCNRNTALCQWICFRLRSQLREPWNYVGFFFNGFDLLISYEKMFSFFFNFFINNYSYKNVKFFLSFSLL